MNTLLSSLLNILRFSCILWYLLWISQPKIDSKHIPVIHFLLSLFLELFTESFSIRFHQCPTQFICSYCWHSSVYAAKNCSKLCCRITVVKKIKIRNVFLQDYKTGHLETESTCLINVPWTRTLLFYVEKEYLQEQKGWTLSINKAQIHYFHNMQKSSWQMLDYICWSDYLSADALLLKCTTKTLWLKNSDSQ